MSDTVSPQGLVPTQTLRRTVQIRTSRVNFDVLVLTWPWEAAILCAPEIADSLDWLSVGVDWPRADNEFLLGLGKVNRQGPILEAVVVDYCVVYVK